MAVITVTDLNKTFPGPPPVHVLRDVNLTIDVGEYVSIVGPSGSGKSTLLNMLGLIDTPTDGSYELDGVETTTLTETERTALRGRRIGFVFQDFHLLPGRSAVENVALGMLYLGIAKTDRLDAAAEALRRVGLGHRIHASAATLSGGERQRVAIARALTGEPAIVLCDEPTGNLDSATTGHVLDILDGLHETGTTLVVITHDDATAARADRHIEIRDGLLGHLEVAR